MTRNTVKEAEFFTKMTRNMVKPKCILLTLKYKRKNNLMVATQIYNTRHKYKKTIKGATTVQVFGRRQVCFKYRTVGESKIVIRKYEVIINNYNIYVNQNENNDEIKLLWFIKCI